MKKNLKKRLGCLKLKQRDVSSHAWFKGVNWKKIYLQIEVAPVIPEPNSPIEIIMGEKQTEETIKLNKRCQFETEFDDF